MRDGGPILLVTRPAGSGERFAEAVAQSWAQDLRVIQSPLLRIEELWPKFVADGLSGVIVTSENGAAALARLGVDRSLPVWAVGDRTADVAGSAGYAATSAKGDVEDLIALILDVAGDGPFLHVRGEHSRGDLASRLTEAGRPCGEVFAYRQIEAALTADARDALAGSSPVFAPLFSPRTVSVLAQQGPFSAPLHTICISDAVAAEARSLGPVTLRQSDEPTGPAMINATIAALEEAGAA
jgi:uroporphyrinogen-III synthase